MSRNRSIGPPNQIRRNLLAMAVAQSIMVAAPQAATITVNDNSDAASANCTLRNAIDSANTKTAVGGCVAGSGTELVISSQITIQGPGAKQLTLSGGYSSRVFNIGATGTDPVILDSLTIADGNALNNNGGAILSNSKNLTISNSAITRSMAQSGGGFANKDGTASLLNSTVSGNTATSYCGGIHSYGNGLITVTNCTVSAN
jgi:hypothetical protein